MAQPPETHEDADPVAPWRRWSLRTWVIITAALWLAAIVTLIIVLLLWRTPPLQPVPLS